MKIGKWALCALTVLCSVSAIGCGRAEPEFEPNVFSESDLCIVKKAEADSRVCYGTSRQDAEKVLGAGGEEIGGDVAYANGVQVSYREDKIVGIDLLEGSPDHYRTARGAQVGMSREELVALYGDLYLQSGSPDFLDYYYDSANAALLVEPTAALVTGGPEEAENWKLLSAKMNGEQNAEFISLMDRRQAVYSD